jgi:hypothetical protein
MGKETNSIIWVLMILITVVSVSCKRTPEAKADEIVINGALSNSTGKMIRLSAFDGKVMHLIDSIQLEEDEPFSFRVKIKDAGFYVVSSRKNDDAILIGDKGETINLTGDAMHLMSTWNAKGSEETRLYLNYWNSTRMKLKRVDSITFIFRSSQMNPEYLTTRIRLDSIFNGIMEKQHEDATRFLNKNPGALASLLVIDSKFSRQPLFYEERDINYFKMLDSALTKKYSKNKLVTDFHNRVLQILKRIKNHSEINRILPPGELSPSYTPKR